MFTNCVSPSPVCMPCRSALATGRLPRQVGALAMSGDLSPQHRTMYHALQDAGYWTGAVGKLHWHQGWNWGAEHGKGHRLAAMTDFIKQYGLDHVWEVSGKQLAQRNYCQWAKRLDEKGVLKAYRDDTQARGRNGMAPTATDFTGEAFKFDTEDYVDIVTADQIINAIDDRPADKPFFLFGSFCGPHPPFDPLAEYLEQIPYEEVDDFIVADGQEPLADDVKKNLYRLRRAYKGMIRCIDDQVGRILEKLEADGLLENTVVMFTADHGEMLGDHGRVQKSTHQKESVIVPTAIRHPHHVTGSTVDTMTQVFDLTATALEVAGLDPQQALLKQWPAFHAHIPCRSLMPVLLGETDRVRDFAFSECMGNGLRWEMVRTQQWKWVRDIPNDDASHASESLIDLQADPNEQHDVIAQFADVAAQCRHWRDLTLDHALPAQLNHAPIDGDPR